MTPCDFFLFDQVQKPLRGTRFNSRKEVMEKSKTALMAIPYNNRIPEMFRELDQALA